MTAFVYLGERARYAAEFLRWNNAGSRVEHAVEGFWHWFPVARGDGQLITDEELIGRAEYWIEESADWATLEEWIEAKRQGRIE